MATKEVEVVDVHWFNMHYIESMHSKVGKFGIVKLKDETDKISFKIGWVMGEDEDFDKNMVSKLGAPFLPSAIKEFMK